MRDAGNLRFFHGRVSIICRLPLIVAPRPTNLNGHVNPFPRFESESAFGEKRCRSSLAQRRSQTRALTHIVRVSRISGSHFQDRLSLVFDCGQIHGELDNFCDPSSGFRLSIGHFYGDRFPYGEPVVASGHFSGINHGG
ncbi:hypothetical protein SBA5_30005 [Candidatus Sulfotelmatomonas gaucii]|uniref:Uncharacterized protein n=1 Tax=Candidatus Sulfuritelmatomonas gaucii TaxID=2043161 RepID=A0A2N9LC07_9BACT|nr:hypothetical protein SBA5_30005 [Candidatus Sulfotelmatomonas gaucii]